VSGQSSFLKDESSVFNKFYSNIFHQSPTILTLIVIAIIFFLLKGLVNFLLLTTQAKMATSIISKTRKSLLDGITHLNYKTYTTTDMGAVLNVSTSEVSKLNTSLHNYLNAWQYVIMSVGYIIIAFIVDPFFSALIIILSLVFFYFYRIVIGYFRKLSGEIVQTGNLYNSFLSQILSNFKYLKTTNVIDFYSKRIGEKIEYSEKLNFRFLQINALTNSLREPIILILISAVILIKYAVYGNIGTNLVFTMLLFYRTLNFFLLTQSNWQSFQQNSGSIDMILAVRDKFQKGKEDFYTGDKFRFSDSMVLSDTFVSYNENNVLTDISITIPKNNMIALVGPSGSGKTTLVAVLTGLIPPDKGEFRIDNHLLSEYDLADFRSKIGYVSQDPVIFNDSIFNNVTLWDAKTELSLQKFNSVCRLTHLDEMINNLDKKEDSGTGDFGITLSGGQKQRISIARELYRDVELLVFDEATSSLDAITEQIIRENIQSIRGKVTIILIAHRLSTIRFADRIYFIEGGRITASGTYDELMQSSPDFLKMVNLQSG